MQCQVEEGEVSAAILRIANDVKSDLIVLGTQGRTALDRLLIGSVAEVVLRKALCPVLTVRAATARTLTCGRNATEETAAVS
jgi:nucleotide-binding universal stress UspA family protein